MISNVYIYDKIVSKSVCMLNKHMKRKHVDALNTERCNLYQSAFDDLLPYLHHVEIENFSLRYC